MSERRPSRRQPRPHPRARRAGEQPQGRQRRAPEAPADRVHRRLGLGQELARVRHDRRGVAAADQRDLQRVRAGLHADAGAARRRRPRRADDGDPRRPGADGLQPALHGRHRHGRRRDAAHPVQPAREAAHRRPGRVLLQRRLGPRERRDHGRARRQDHHQERELQPHRRHVPALRGPRLGQRLRPDRALRRQQVAQRGRAHDPRLQHGGLVRAHLPRLRLLRPGQADQEVQQARAQRPPLQGGDQDQGRRHQPDLRRADPVDPAVDALQGRRRDAAAHPRLRRAGGGVHHLPRLRRHPARRGRAVVEDRGRQHRRRLRDADHRSGRVGARARRAVGRAAARGAGADARLVRGDRARLPLAEPAVGHAVGRRGAADQDDPPARLLAHRRHLRVRRADRRAAPARHRADERPAAASCATRATRCSSSSTSRRRSRSPTTSSTSARGAGDRGWRGGVRGHGRGAAGQRHDHRPAPRRPGRAEGVGAEAVGRAGGPRRQHPQPAGRRRRHPARRAGGRHRRGGVGQELADRRLGGRAGTAWCRSTRARSAARGAATRRPTPACSTRSARRSRRPTA